MAPTKEKTEKLSAEQASNLMLDYLRKQNRPYSATDVSANLKNRVTKAVAAKVLKEMHERKEIEGRAAGGCVLHPWKQIVYHAIQNPSDAATPEDLAATDASIARLRDSTTTLRTTEKALRASLAAMNATLSTSDLRVAVQALEAEKEATLARLLSLRSGSIKPVSAEERAGVEKEWKTWEKREKVRAAIGREMWGMVCEALPRGVVQSEVKVCGTTLRLLSVCSVRERA
ncbi:Tat binding protein 1-interacting protein-domain-containing protein [Cryomyces antarcticus]